MALLTAPPYYSVLDERLDTSALLLDMCLSLPDPMEPILGSDPHKHCTNGRTRALRAIRNLPEWVKRKRRLLS